MVNKDRLSSGAVDKKSANNRYAVQMQSKTMARFSAKVLACLIASFSSFANLVLMFIYVVNANISITIITLINVGLMAVVILCFIIWFYAQRKTQPERKRSAVLTGYKIFIVTYLSFNFNSLSVAEEQKKVPFENLSNHH